MDEFLRILIKQALYGYRHDSIGYCAFGVKSLAMFGFQGRCAWFYDRIPAYFHQYGAGQ
jgi:hypothetical protein